MDKFVTRFRAEQVCNDDSESASDFELQPPPRKTAALAGDKSSFCSSGSKKMRAYKDKLSYNPSRKEKHPWIEYNSCHNSMICTIPVQTRDAWVTRTTG